ncbi:MAG: DUF2867 domain-containing protein [Sulfitobacter sp.]|nr:DUF2867 domain-containing protein [Sulfitobacter sp.]MDG1353965.1 DUF2867 domain-containing protein [Sulfitobacter sp.]
MTNSLTTIQPTQIELVAPKAELNFFDQQSVELETPMTPLQVWTFLMKNPLPMIGFAFKVRDAISKWFGVKEIGGFSGHIPEFVQTGDKLDFFLVETVNDTVLTLSARDRHLDTVTCVTTSAGSLTITSSVKVHNRFGWFYMLAVGPAHKLIVRSILKRLKRELG